MIHLTQITKQHGQRILYQDASLQVVPGDRIGLVGPNGAGKTTIFRIIARQEGVDKGDINISDKVLVGYFSQDAHEMKGSSPVEAVKGAAGKVALLGQQMAQIEKQLEDSAENPLSDEAMESLLANYGDIQHEYEQRGGYDLDTRAKEILTGLGIGPQDYDRSLETFSGGWKMRIELAKILILNPDVLLMDEPTNHLDVETIIWLEEWLGNFKGSLVMTCHDRDFMNRLVTKIVEVANKTITTFSGNYDFFLRERDVRKEQLIASFERQQDMLAKEEEFIARFAARASHAAQVQSRVKKLEKLERIEIPAEEKTMEMVWPQPPRSGSDVVKMENLAKSWVTELDQVRPVFSGVTGMVMRLDKVAVVGVNGAGKSTLLKVITGMTEATSGLVQLGANVKVGYFSQNSIDVLNPENTILDEVWARVPNASIGYVRNLLGAFLFSGDDAAKKISILSGGEKSRVLLATLLANPLNLLVLDEPTNHLDIQSREVLMKAVRNFDGTVILVSHDRHFLRSIVNRVFEVDHGALHVYNGDYHYYLEQKAKMKV